MGYLPINKQKSKVERSLSSTHSRTDSKHTLESLSVGSQSSDTLLHDSQMSAQDNKPLYVSTQSEELNYVMAHLDLIPDMRDVRMHVGLPLPDNELSSLLMVTLHFPVNCSTICNGVCSNTHTHITSCISRTQASSPHVYTTLLSVHSTQNTPPGCCPGFS